MLAQFTNFKDKLFMKTEIRIIAEMTDEQCEVLLSELINTSEIIGIKLEVESSKLGQHDVVGRSELLVCKGKCDLGYTDGEGNELFCSIKK